MTTHYPVAWDTETALIRPALNAPPLVCVSYARPGQSPGLVHWTDALARLRGWLTDPSTLLIGHFVAYDCAVICAEFPELIPLVFAAYKQDRITCTKKRQQLLDIAGGCFRGEISHGKWHVHHYDLSSLAKRHLGAPLQKDGWRLAYAEFRDVPLDRWVEHAKGFQSRCRARRAELPALTKDTEFEDEAKNLDAISADVPEGVVTYPLADATATLGVWQSQEVHAEYLHDQYRQSYADFVLYLSSCWGLRTDPAGVEALRAELDEAYGELSVELQALGMVREDGTRNMRVIKDKMLDACKAYSLTVRRTDGHDGCELGDACTEHVSLDADACEAVANAARESLEGDETFVTYSEFAAISKMLKNDCKMLAAGTVYPVHTRYDLAETGRTTSASPNIQNLNTGRIKNVNSQAQRLRKGVRQAFVPRPGKCFAQADFPQLELYTLAQCCYSWVGYSELGKTLNAGLDPHLAVAAKIVGCSYDEAAANKKREDIDHARQIGKVFNFGKPGGLGAKKLILFARKTYGVSLSVSQVEQYTNQWHEAFPEMRAHFARVNALFGEASDRCSVETLFTKRRRGGATYCAACNNGFQALGVDCAKQALCLVGEAEYVRTESPLYGSRTVAFVHDELIVETDLGPGAHDAAFELAHLMVQGANKYLPNVPISVDKLEPTLMLRWSKNARQIWDSNRRLIPWDM
jgi:hypothetical protein